MLKYYSDLGGVAQGLEQRAHNLLVTGSNPVTPTTFGKISEISASKWIFYLVSVYGKVRNF